jgi:hypothetical protein
MFDEITLLRQRLTVDSTMEVIHAGHRWTAKFEWYPPASAESIAGAQAELGGRVPGDYTSFLALISNGAVLFQDAQHNQWGYILYGTQMLAQKQAYWQRNLRKWWTSSLVAFGESLGDANVLVFDTNRPYSPAESYAVLDGNAIDPMGDWPIASRSYHEWLDHLVTAQGDKYWAWE